MLDLNCPVSTNVYRQCCLDVQIIWGVLIMTSVSAAWVGATHLLKSTFQTVQFVSVAEKKKEPAGNSTTPTYQLQDEVRPQRYRRLCR